MAPGGGNRLWRSILGAALLLSGLPAAQSAADEVQQNAEKLEFFEKKIRPLLIENCYACHSAETKPAGGLRVDDINGLRVGGESGAAVVPGNADDSLLLSRVLPDAKRRMPQDGKPLTEQQIADLKTWITDGAHWPVSDEHKPPQEDLSWYADLRANHWAWQPIQEPAVPQINDEAWARSDIDRFIFSTLTANGLTPNGEAGRRELLRRITYDLTGLPPRTEELEAFLNDTRPDAFERVVDRLLASPAFGERWGRHWLDVARYGESTGPSRNIPYPHAWRYRDYVIRSVNEDLPFNQFIREQLAGDLLQASDAAEQDRLAIATGFLALGVKDVNQRFKVRFEMDNVDEQIDVVSRSFLGLTVSCARCHDHKFDPIPTADYYALAGIFTSTQNASGLRNQMGGSGLAYYVPANLVILKSVELPEAPAEQVAEITARVAEAKKKFESVRGTPEGMARQPDGRPLQRHYRDELDKAQAELNQLTDPASRGAAVHGVKDAAQVADTQIRLRGEAENLGPVVPRGFLTAFDVSGSQPVGANSSGRLELAQWIANDQNPLTSRVIVNRVWHHLFGQGIVTTVDNFGTTGDEPSHPELLDYLASTFVRNGWKLKPFIRTIVLSRAYQQSSENRDEGLAKDPQNRLIWKHSIRRLSTEEIRDSMLAVSGELNLQPPATAEVSELQMREIRDNGPESAKLQRLAGDSLHRSVYLPALRGIVPRSLEAFDPVEQTLVTGRRESTNVPGQALFLLNSGFVRTRSLSTARNLTAQAELSDDQFVRQVWKIAYGREIDPEELAAALEFVSDFRSESPSPQQLLAAEASQPQVASGDTVTPATTTPATGTPAGTGAVQGDETTENGVLPAEESQAAIDSNTAARAALVQAVFASAEFRYVR